MLPSTSPAPYPISITSCPLPLRHARHPLPSYPTFLIGYPSAVFPSFEMTFLPNLVDECPVYFRSFLACSRTMITLPSVVIALPLTHSSSKSSNRSIPPLCKGLGSEEDPRRWGRVVQLVTDTCTKAHSQCPLRKPSSLERRWVPDTSMKVYSPFP